MPEPIKEEKVEEKPLETPVEESKEAGYDYTKDHDRTPAQIVNEPVVEPVKEEEEPEKPPEVVANPLDEAKKYLEEQRKLDAEIAKTEAEKHAKATVEQELKRQREEEANKVKLSEDLKPIWEKEGREPKDYDEIARENRRITKIELKAEIEAEQRTREAEQAKQTQVVQQQNDESLKLTQAQIQRDMEELYEGNFIPRPKSGDANDPGMKMQDELFKLGIKVNEERKAKGQPTEPSIAKIFFMYGKDINKVEQPAGANAPVSGARPATPEKEDEGYVYAKDHRDGESIVQYRARILRNQS